MNDYAIFWPSGVPDSMTTGDNPNPMTSKSSSSYQPTNDPTLSSDIVPTGSTSSANHPYNIASYVPHASYDPSRQTTTTSADSIQSGSASSEQPEQQEKEQPQQQQQQSKDRKLKGPRVPRACDSCRKKKIRCDIGGNTTSGNQEIPCAPCKLAKLTCTFDEKPTKRGPPKGYVESLERRLEAMEGLLQALSGGNPSKSLSQYGSGHGEGGEGGGQLDEETNGDEGQGQFSPSTVDSAPTNSAESLAREILRKSIQDAIHQAHLQNVDLKALKSSYNKDSGQVGSSGASGDDQDIFADKSIEVTRPTDFIPSTKSVRSTSGSNPVFDLDSINTLADEMAELTVENDRYVGRGSGLHLARSIEDYSEVQIHDDPSPSLVELLLQQEHRRQAESYSLPPADLSRRLIDEYFANVNINTCLLHRPSFERAIQGGLLERDSSFRSLFFACCALGARFIDDDERLKVPPYPYPSSSGLPGGSFSNLYDDRSNGTQSTGPDGHLPPRSGGLKGVDQSRGYEYFRASTGAASPSLVSAKLFDIEACVLHVVWLLGSASPISAWSAGGFAIRRLVDVGAHREFRTRWNSSPLEDQLRKRAFYSLVGIDRFTSSTLGRPLAIQEEDYDLRPPIDISDRALDEWNLNRELGLPLTPSQGAEVTEISVTIVMARLNKIMSKVMRLLYGTKHFADTPQKLSENVTELDSMLNEWLTIVPDHLRWNPNEQDPRWLSHSAFIYSAYYCCQIAIHRDFISPSRSRLHKFPSLAICSNAARSCAHVLDTLQQRNLLQQAFHYAPLTAIMSALILLIGVFSSSDVATLSSSAMRDIFRCLNVLQELSQKTYIAERCFTGLTKLVQAATDHANRTRLSALNTTTTSTASSNPTLKRSNPWDVLDDQNSPTSSISIGVSPSSSGVNEDGSVVPTNESHRDGSKQEQDVSRGGHHSKNRKVVAPLPMTTKDLSLLTFHGRPSYYSNVGTNQAQIHPPNTMNRGSFNNGLPSTLSSGELFPAMQATTSVGSPSAITTSSTTSLTDVTLPNLLSPNGSFTWPQSPASSLGNPTSEKAGDAFAMFNFGSSANPNLKSVSPEEQSRSNALGTVPSASVISGLPSYYNNNTFDPMDAMAPLPTSSVPSTAGIQGEPDQQYNRVFSGTTSLEVPERTSKSSFAGMGNVTDFNVAFGGPPVQDQGVFQLGTHMGGGDWTQALYGGEFDFSAIAQAFAANGNGLFPQPPSSFPAEI